MLHIKSEIDFTEIMLKNKKTVHLKCYIGIYLLYFFILMANKLFLHTCLTKQEK